MTRQSQSIQSMMTKAQEKKIVQFGSDAFKVALKEFRLTVDGANRVIEHCDEFRSAIRNAADHTLKNLSVSSDRFKDEEVKSNYGYFSDYREPVKISDQIDILRSHWPELSPDAALCYMREMYQTLHLPGWEEGPFAIIRPGFFSSLYGEEVAEVLKSLAKNRKFVSYYEDKLGPQYLRQSERTLSKLRILMEQQPGSNILISPAQLGVHHRGRSSRRACEVFGSSEYGSGAKDVGTMILTNPIRLQQDNDLCILCAGDECGDADDDFSSVPLFDFDDDWVRFYAYWCGYASGYCGSASAFLSQ